MTPRAARVPGCHHVRHDAGADASWTGGQWLRGDEANETSPLGDYLSLQARLGWEAGRWEVRAVVRNVLLSRAAIFGTFNENRRTGELERSLTPMQARSVRISLRRAIGG